MSFLTCRIGLLTKSFGQLALKNHTGHLLLAVPTFSHPPARTALFSRLARINTIHPAATATRLFSSDKKQGDDDKATETSGEAATETDDDAAAAPKEEEEEKRPTGVTDQQAEWVKFQQSIAVEGFDTGQVLELTSPKKSRGGRRKRRKHLSKLEKKLIERQRVTQSESGQYPPLRYSEEETERLLMQAYMAIPLKTGKRGTRRKKRNERRLKLVREIHAKYKAQVFAAQLRKMEWRSQKAKETAQIRTEAPDVRKRERDYQIQNYRRWAQNMEQGKIEREARKKLMLSAAGANQGATVESNN